MKKITFYVKEADVDLITEFMLPAVAKGKAFGLSVKEVLKFAEHKEEVPIKKEVPTFKPTPFRPTPVQVVDKEPRTISGAIRSLFANNPGWTYRISVDPVLADKEFVEIAREFNTSLKSINGLVSKMERRGELKHYGHGRSGIYGWNTAN